MAPPYSLFAAAALSPHQWAEATGEVMVVEISLIRLE